jgi:hypothetical protein
MTILLGEQNVPTGRITLHGRAGDLLADPKSGGLYLGLNPPAKLLSARAESINVAEKCQRENNP